MAIRIGEDGTIISDGVEVPQQGRTIIREDGTIETTSVDSGYVPPRPQVYHAPPSSPLENRGRTQQQPQTEQHEEPDLRFREERHIESRNLADLEYDLMVAEGHYRGSLPKGMMIACGATLVGALLISPILLVGTAITGILAGMGFAKRASYEEEVKHLKEQIENLKSHH